MLLFLEFQIQCTDLLIFAEIIDHVLDRFWNLTNCKK